MATLPTEKNNMLGFEYSSSLRHWLKVPNVLIAPLPIAVCSE
jgi:hypothetical protein